MLSTTGQAWGKQHTRLQQRITPLKTASGSHEFATRCTRQSGADQPESAVTTKSGVMGS